MTLSVWQSARRYAVNILNENQGATSTRFARTDTVKWDEMGDSIGQIGTMLIPNAPACFECRSRMPNMTEVTTRCSWVE